MNRAAAPLSRCFRGRFHVGGLPLIESILQRIRLREILADFIAPSRRELISSIDSLVLLAVNITLAKDPLYELAQWIDWLDLRALGFRSRPPGRFTDRPSIIQFAVHQSLR